MKTRRILGGLLLLCSALLLSSVCAAAPAKPLPLPRDSVYQLPLILINQDGKAADWRSGRGKPRLVTMFYTACPYMCPLIVDTGKAIEKSLTPTQRDKLRLLFISMDPANDTPAALLALARKRKLDTNHWTLASPQPKAVSSVAGLLGVRYRQLADGGFNHNGVLVLLDRDGRIVASTDQMGSKPDPEFVQAVRRELDRP